EKTKLKIKRISSGTSGSMKNISKSQFACEIAIKVWRNSLKFSII
ncbi:restriction endonuclease subunit S, partial [Streptococcus pneumoniae]|nr:restriction endonuclease subunit S [Streptococcus pneumoniae]